MNSSWFALIKVLWAHKVKRPGGAKIGLSGSLRLKLVHRMSVYHPNRAVVSMGDNFAGNAAKDEIDDTHHIVPFVSC